MGIRTTRQSALTRRGLALLATIAVASLAALVPGGSAHAATRAEGPALAADWGATNVIINYSSNKCVQPQSTSANALVVQRTCNGSSLQKWTATPVGNGYYWLVNRASNMCMDLQVNSEAEVGNGTLVQQFYCSTAYTSEEWNRSSGSRLQHFQVWTRIKGLCLDVQNRSSADGARLQVYSCKYYEDAQEFRFVNV